MTDKLSATMAFAFRQPFRNVYALMLIAAMAMGALLLDPLAGLISKLFTVDPSTAKIIEVEIAAMLILCLVGLALFKLYKNTRDPLAEDRELSQNFFMMVHGCPAQGEFKVFFQPKVSLATGTVTTVEALARWRHPKLGNISQAKFVRIAENEGLIDRLTMRVVDSTARQMASLRTQGINIRVSINISGLNISAPSFVEQIVDTLAQHGIEPKDITLEITETAAISDKAESKWVIKELKDLGFSISLDDFGTGYASLLALHDLAFDEIKIDRRFVRDIKTNPVSRSIVDTTVRLGNSLGLHVVAEGVECAEDLEMLAKMGVHEGQGFFIARPMPFDRFAEWIDNKDVALSPVARSFGRTHGRSPTPAWVPTGLACVAALGDTPRTLRQPIG